MKILVIGQNGFGKGIMNSNVFPVLLTFFPGKEGRKTVQMVVRYRNKEGKEGIEGWVWRKEKRSRH